MKLNRPQDYVLEMDGVKYTVFSEDGSSGFSAPASLKKTPKLYSLYDDKVLHYIGITSQPMSTRLRAGLKATGQNGYHGYKWKHMPRLYLSVWTVSNCEEGESYRVLESIEAETVFLYRKRHKRWPESQHEIHFHNNNGLNWRIPTEIIDHIEKKIK